jgi:hypothetical protein
MTWLRKAKLLNAVVAALALLAWLTGTNHCVFGLAMQPRQTAASVSHCPEHSKKSDATSQGASGMLACCQGLQSPTLEAAKANIAFNPVPLGIQMLAVGHLGFPEARRTILPSTEYDTGPPSACSFVETVLGRFLRENGPPLRS